MPITGLFFRSIGIAILVACSVWSAHAGLVVPASGPGIRVELVPEVVSADSSSFILHFSRAGNLILVKARADTTEGSFILDTGCPHLVLNLTYFRNYPSYDNDEERNGITGTDFTVKQTKVANFSLGDARYYQVPADLANLGNIENSKGVKILGLIGMSLLDKFEMIIDFEKNQIHLHRFNRKNSSSYRHELLKDETAYSTVPIRIMDNRIMLETVLGGKKIKLIVDSGAETNMLDSRLPDKVFESISITGRTLLTGVGNKKIEVLKGDLESLQIGDQSIKNLPVLITNLEKTCFAYGGCVDGILGFDFLSLKKIGFNFVTNKMYVWK